MPRKGRSHVRQNDACMPGACPWYTFTAGCTKYINRSVRRGRSKCGVHARSGLAHSSRHVICEARTECMTMAGRRHIAVLLRTKKKGHTKPQTTLDAVSREISASSVLTAASIAAHIRQITACNDSRHGSRRAMQRPGTKAAAACRGGFGW